MKISNRAMLAICLLNYFAWNYLIFYVPNIFVWIGETSMKDFRSDLFNSVFELSDADYTGVEPTVCPLQGWAGSLIKMVIRWFLCWSGSTCAFFFLAPVKDFYYFGMGKIALFWFIPCVITGNVSKAFLFWFANTVKWLNNRTTSGY